MNDVIFIIPARGGSKGIPKKNLIEILGVPLIGWTIECCKNSSFYSDNIYVSSDCENILKYSESLGSNIIKRPLEISGDFCSSESAILHAIEEVYKKRKFDTVIFLQPTSPLRDSIDIDRSIEEFNENNLDSLFSSCVLEDFFYWKKNQNQFLSVNYDYKNRKRRQDVEESFLENGSFYIFKRKGFLENKNRLFGKIGTFVMENYKKHEIDNIEDIDLIEYYLKKFKKNGI